MSHMIVNGAKLSPDPAGAVYWPEQAALAVADLHFEKGSAFAARGLPLPPYDTAATLSRLAALIRRYEPAVVICLGDSFHDKHAGDRLADDDAEQLRQFARGRHWIWIVGNHDPEPPVHLGGEALAELRLGALTFRHLPRPKAPAGEIAGHLHPKAAVRVRGQRIVRRCFVSDGLRLVMPAFGAFTGGLDVLDPAFQPLFPGPFQAHMLGRHAVYTVSRHRLT